MLVYLLLLVCNFAHKLLDNFEPLPTVLFTYPMKAPMPSYSDFAEGILW